MAKHERDILKLLMKLVGHKTGEISNVEFKAQKPQFPDALSLEKKLNRCTPEEMGVDSGFVMELFKKLYDNDSCHLHKIMMLRHGNVIGEFCSVPYEKDVWHVTHSMCKSVTGMAIGLLVAEGKLTVDTRIYDIFSDEINPFKAIFSNNITVKHLLTMTSGVSINESGAVVGNNWKKMFFESQQKNTPGTVFEYNSMNSYMLSAIVTKITGESMFDYLKPRLFEPLDIQRAFWETCPLGITKGGWGMFLRIEDMAKLGQLYLNGGVYEGKTILPAEWVEEATKTQVETGKPDSPGYGYQLWCNDNRGGAYTFNGMLGQNVYVYPDLDMMIVTNAGNEDLFQSGNMSSIIRREMSAIEVSDEPIEINDNVIKSQRKLKDYIDSIEGAKEFNLIERGGWSVKKLQMNRGKTRRSFESAPLYRDRNRPSGCSDREVKKRLNGSVYTMDDTGVGLMPLLMQVMHNNFTDGISEIGFAYEEATDAFYMLIKEGEQLHKIRCSDRSNPHYYDLDEHGEVYRLCVITEVSVDEYKRPVLRNEFCFVEDSTVRVMNIYLGKRAPLQRENTYGKDKLPPEFIGIRFDEVPGNSMLFGILDQFGSLDTFTGINGIVMGFLNEYGAMDAITLAIRDTVRPKLHGKLKTEVENSSDSEYDVNKDNLISEATTEAVMEDD